MWEAVAFEDVCTDLELLSQPVDAVVHGGEEKDSGLCIVEGGDVVVGVCDVVEGDVVRDGTEGHLAASVRLGHCVIPKDANIETFSDSAFNRSKVFCDADLGN